MKKTLGIILSGIIFFPFLLLLGLSVGKDWRFPDVLPGEWTLDHWSELFQLQGDLTQSLLLSLGISLLVATLSTVIGFITSKYIAYHPKKKTLLALAYFPYVLAPIIYAAVLYFYFIVLGLSGNFFGVVIGQMIIAYPFAVIIFVGYWNKRMQAMEQLVYTLGGTPWQAYQKVLFPVSKGILMVCFFQTFLISWFEYGLTMLIGVGKIQTLTLKVFHYVNEANIYHAALASCLLFLPPWILILINKRIVFRTES
ncbi:MAG: ABC transporter permease [Bacteroidota bacterium]